MNYDDDYFFNTAKEIQYYKAVQQEYFKWMLDDFKYRVEIEEAVLTPCEKIFGEYIVRAIMPPENVIPNCYSTEAYQRFKASQNTSHEETGRARALNEGL